MADLEISFPYKSLTRFVFILLSIAYGMLGMAILFAVGSLFLAAPNVVNQTVTYQILKLLVLIGGAVAFAYGPFLLFNKYTHGNNVFANKDGFGVPGAIILPSRWLAWSELTAADFVDYGFWQTIRLTFKPGGEVLLHTNRMPDSGVEQLLMALEVWGVKASWSEALVNFRDGLHNKKVGIDDKTYTQLWDEELNRRFNTTTFVPLEPDTTLASGRLKILRQIAFGGFSAVYLAEDDERQQVVIKESVTSAQADNSELEKKALEFFKREASILAELKNDNIARVLDNFIENGRTYLVLEYIAGETLREHVKRLGPQKEEIVIDWMRKMALILEYLHGQEPAIIHRDFTPDNLVLTPDRSLVLIDFGAANQYVAAATGTLVGKQSYMPPEQVRGKTEPLSDLYALGCTAYFLVTGHDPEPLTRCLANQEHPTISARLHMLIAHLTEQDTAQRLASASVLLAQLNDMNAMTDLTDMSCVKNEQAVSLKVGHARELMER